MITHSTDPFPHWVIDDFLPEELALDAWSHFHAVSHDDSPWTKRHHLYSRNKYTRTHNLPKPVEHALTLLESEGMRHYLEKLTGVGPLLSDPDRFGGGQHVTLYGGKLGIHADFTHHPKTGLRRALNLLLYLNYLKRSDPPSYAEDLASSSLELWDTKMTRCVVTIPPVFNRAVIFKTSTTSFHGHPEPSKYDGTHDVNEFLSEGRMSLAVYYYVKDEPGSYHFVPRLKYTDYRPRPWEYGLRARRWLSKLVKGRPA